MNKLHWCIYYLIKSMNKSHKLGRAHGWILYCGLIINAVVGRISGWFCDIGCDLGEYDEFVARICGRLDFVCARLWSFVPSSFPVALKFLSNIIKSWNFQDLIRLCSSESSEWFLHNILYIFQKKWPMIKRLKLIKPFFLDQLSSLDRTQVEQIMAKKCISS